MAKGRDSKGQFTEGNPGGPGRPRRQVEVQYLTALTEAISIDDWRAVVGRAVEDAKKGDARARDWISRYMVGDCVVEAVRKGELSADGEPNMLVNALGTWG